MTNFEARTFAMRAIFATKILLVSTLVLTSITCRQQRAAWRYALPPNFSGWVEIEFERSDCQPLTYRGGEVLLLVPPTGRVCTSSRLETGWAHDEFIVMVPGGHTRSLSELPGENQEVWDFYGETASEPGRPSRHFVRFFVGTREQHQAAIRLDAGQRSLAPSARW
jgi:hypothetical protein